MKKGIKNLSINGKLIIGLVSVLLSIFIISFFFLKQTNDLSLQTQNIYNHPLTVRRAIGNIKSSVLVMRVEFRNVLINEELDRVLDAKKRYAVAKQVAINQFDILNERYLGPKEDIALLHASFMQWDRMRQDMINSSDLHKSDHLLMHKLQSAHMVSSREELMRDIARIETFALRKADHFYEQTLHINEDIKRQNILLVSLIFFIIIITVLRLRRSISVPVKALINTALKLKNGNMKVRSAITSSDEFGLLASTFNDMADTIEDELKVKSKVLHLTEIMSESDEMESFCQSMIQGLMKDINAQLGAFYLLDSEQRIFSAYCSFGIEVTHCPSFSADAPVGEFAQALSSGKISYLKAVPADHYLAFESTSGSFIPKDIITIPIHSNDDVVAIVSMASIYSFSSFSKRVIDELLSVITFRVNSVLLYKKVLAFNHSLKEKNEVLDEQKKELRRMTDELVEQNTELEQQKYQLNEMNRMKSNFLSSMSHELRTPLNSVIALSGVLHRQLRHNIPEEQYNYIGVIERNGKYLLNLINDILDLSRIESGKIEVDKRAFSIRTLLDEVLAMIQIQAEQKGLTLLLDIPEEALVINSDYDKCLHIVQNLMSNAVKFTNEGQVSIKVKSLKNKVQLVVSDTGIGIDKRDLSHIFDEFRQADGGDARKYGGTGLGLSIAEKYTQLLGGTIKVVSHLGVGSTFTLTLPTELSEVVQEEVSRDLKEQSIERVEDCEVSGAGKKLLLVEDTEAIVVQMVNILEAQGYEVCVAENGVEAIQALENDLPDAIITDLMMPEMSGLELIKHIRNIDRFAYLPVMILTAKMISKVELAEIKNNNVYQLIQKGSVSKDELLMRVAQLVGESLEEKRINVENDVLLPIVKQGKINILTVEDNPDNALALRALIGDKCNLYEASNAADGMELAHQHTIDVILMDIAMPKMNGFEAFRAIRQDDKLKHIPVIVLTSSAMQGDKQTFLDFGFNAYVSKPIIPEQLYAAINTWVKTSDEYSF